MAFGTQNGIKRYDNPRKEHTMKKTLKILLIIVLAIIVLVGVLLLVVNSSLNSAAKLQTYDFGSDKIPSFNSVVGERKVTGVGSSSSTNGTQQKDYTYETQSRDDDLDAYYDALKSAGFLVLKPMDGNTLKGSMQLGIASADEGKIILIDLSWDNAKVSVALAKGDGTITPN